MGPGGKLSYLTRPKARSRPSCVEIPKTNGVNHALRFRKVAPGSARRSGLDTNCPSRTDRPVQPFQQGVGWGFRAESTEPGWTAATILRSVKPASEPSVEAAGSGWGLSAGCVVAASCGLFRRRSRRARGGCVSVSPRSGLVGFVGRVASCRDELWGRLKPDVQGGNRK